MYCLFRGGVGHGPWIHSYLSEIQAAMDELEPGYHLTIFQRLFCAAILVFVFSYVAVIVQ